MAVAGGGRKLTIQGNSSGAAADFLARAHASGTKGLRDMLQSGGGGGPWRMETPRPIAESTEAAALEYAAAHNGWETDISRWRRWIQRNFFIGRRWRPERPMRRASAGYVSRVALPPSEFPARNRELRRYR